jgi:hypothetical protein
MDPQNVVIDRIRQTAIDRARKRDPEIGRFEGRIGGAGQALVDHRVGR